MTKFFAASLLPSVMSPLSDCAETLSEALASNRIGLVLRESCISCYIYTVSSVCFVIEEIKVKNDILSFSLTLNLEKIDLII